MKFGCADERDFSICLPVEPRRDKCWWKEVLEESSIGEDDRGKEVQYHGTAPSSPLHPLPTSSEKDPPLPPPASVPLCYPSSSYETTIIVDVGLALRLVEESSEQGGWSDICGFTVPSLRIHPQQAFRFFLLLEEPHQHFRHIMLPQRRHGRESIREDQKSTGGRIFKN